MIKTMYDYASNSLFEYEHFEQLRTLLKWVYKHLFDLILDQELRKC